MQYFQAPAAFALRAPSTKDSTSIMGYSAVVCVFGRLGAKAAILRTGPGLGVLQDVDTNFVAMEMAADPVGRVNDGKGFRPERRSGPFSLFRVGAIFFEGFVSQAFQREAVEAEMEIMKGPFAPFIGPKSKGV